MLITGHVRVRLVTTTREGIIAERDTIPGV
jgi:hypothetical protein